MEDDTVVLPIEDSLDLHTFHPRDVPDLIPDYLEACREQGILEVRIIHGKGKGGRVCKTAIFCIIGAMFVSILPAGQNNSVTWQAAHGKTSGRGHHSSGGQSAGIFFLSRPERMIIGKSQHKENLQRR